MADSKRIAAAPSTQHAPHLTYTSWRTPALVVGVALLAHLLLLLPLPLIIHALAGLTLLLLPGLLLSERLLRSTRATWVERSSLGLGLGLAVLVVLGLGLAYLPGPLNRTVVLVGFDLALVVAGGWWMVGQRPKDPHPNPLPKGEVGLLPLSGTGRGGWGVRVLIIPLLLAAALRLTHLGYAEFQGDEARAMLMAAGLGQGRDDVLFVHKKGPGEVLLPALMWSTAGGIDEATARLPFALAGLGVVLAAAALAMRMASDYATSTQNQLKLVPHGLEPALAGLPPGRRMNSAVLAGVLVALVLALDGYLVAFSRIVQYQSLVALMSVLGVWCAWRFYRGAHAGWAMLGAALVGVGTLGHYEAIFALAPMALLIARRLWADRNVKGWLTVGGGASLAFGAVAAFFYLPFALHPHFIETVTYILERRISGGGGGGGPLYNNLVDYFARATFYNSTWHISLLTVALVVIMGWLAYQRLQPTALGWLAVVWPLLSVVLAGFAAPWLQVNGLSLALLLFLPWLAWLLLPSLTDGLRASLLWFLVPFLIAAFLVQKPHTHFYTMMPGWALVVGLGVSTLVERYIRRHGNSQTGTQRDLVTPSTRFPVYLFTALPVFLLLLQLNYLWTVFVRHEAEYKRVYPAARSPLYPVIYGNEPPRGGYFGFPYRAGWGVVSALFANGTLQGSYDSNEEALITGWYTRGAARCVNPRYYIVAENVQDEEKIPLDRIEREYHLLAYVEVDGGQKLRIFSREPVAQPTRYTLADSVRLNPTEGVDFLLGQALAEAVPAIPTDAAFGPIRLLGYEMTPPTVAPGEYVTLTLFWQADARPPSDLTVFTHIEDSRIWGQNDGYPACGTRPTSQWQAGDLIVESRDLKLDPSTPPGDYPVRVGLYDVGTGLRSPATGAAIENGDHAVLGTVTVRP